MNKIILTSLLLILSIPSFASNPWDSLLINNRKVSLNLVKQSPANVGSWFTKATGIIVITDPNFNKSITLNSPNKINLSDCFSMYNKLLEMYNYELVKENKWLVVKPKVKIDLAPLNNIQDLNQKEDVSEIKVIRLKHNNASNVAKIINELFSTRSNIDEILIRINENDTLRSSGQNRVGNN
jgi:hypothetical protein